MRIGVIRGNIFLNIKNLYKNNLLFEKETYSFIGLCMEVHKILGHGFSEIVYKDAVTIESELTDIQIQREKEFKIEYKQQILRHSFVADFVFFDNVIVEIKAAEGDKRC